MIVADRFGKGIRTAPRCADLAERDEERPRHRLRGAPSDGHGGRDARAARRLRDPAGPRPVSSTPCSRSASASRSWGSNGAAPLRPQPLGPRPGRRPKASIRPAAPPAAAAALPAAGAGRRGFGLVTISDAFSTWASSGASTWTRASSRCSSWEAGALLHAARRSVGRLADRVGRMRVFVCGYALLLAVYGVLLLPGLALAEVLVLLAADRRVTTPAPTAC